MRVNSRKFPGTTHELDNARRLRRTVGNISPYPEFRPTRFPHADIIYRLLLTLYRRCICCYLSGGLVNYLAGFFTPYKAVSLLVALTDDDILNILFQRTEIAFTLFHIDDFRFELESDDGMDILHYRVSYRDDVAITVTCIGVDSRDCGPCSNLDFVYFMWTHFERFGFRKHAVTLLPPDLANPQSSDDFPLMRCLTDHRALSDGWRDSSNCTDCVATYHDAVRDICQCRAPTEEEGCACTICRRQPPSLRHAALHMVRQIYNVERFVLTVNTANEEYRFAVSSNSVHAGNLLPPGYPLVGIWFRCDPARFESKFHEDCSGLGSWWWGLYEPNFRDADHSFRGFVQ
jgi:hypothetical protein